MTTTTRSAILRANAIYLLVAAAGGLATDLLGVSSPAAHSRPWSPMRPMPASAWWKRMGSP
jgi:hypothetical protein